MELLLNTNELGYKPFLSSSIKTIILGLKNFCHNQFYSVSLKQLPFLIQELKQNNKKLNLSVNIFASQKDITKLDKIINYLLSLEIDGFIVSDLGVLNLFKKRGVQNRVILDMHTYVTNKYSAKSLLNLGVKRIILPKEITLNDIKEIANNNDNKIEVLCQGYYPITYSKRPILSCYYKNFKLHKNDGGVHYIQEETRNSNYILIEEKNLLSVYNNKQYSLFSHLQDLHKNNINYLRIDTNFMTLEEINSYIDLYSKAAKYIKENKCNEYEKLIKQFNDNFLYETPFLHTESFLLKEGK